MDITDMTPKKYAAEQAKRILRDNQYAPLHEMRPASSNLSDRARNIMAIKPQETYALPKLPGAAGARELIHGKGTYDGAELRPYDGRDGSLRAYTIKSRGISV